MSFPSVNMNHTLRNMTFTSVETITYIASIMNCTPENKTIYISLV